MSTARAGVARSGAIVRFIADVLSLDEASFRELNSHIEPNQHVFCMLHKRWTERGLPADVGWTNRSSTTILLRIASVVMSIHRRITKAS